MAKYEHFDISEDFFDSEVEASFEKPISYLETVKVLGIIHEVLTSPAAAERFDGLAGLVVTQGKVFLRFRYRRSNWHNIGDDAGRLIAQFIFHLLAKIDAQYKLGDHPFPDDNFRYYLNFEDK